MQTQLKMFVQQALISMALFDRDMNYLAASERWVKQYGRGHTDLVGRNHYDVFPDLSEWWKDVYRKTLSGATLKDYGSMWIQADGSKVWLSWVAMPWFDKTGAVGGMIFSAEDITARKQAEDAIRDSEERLRGFLENSATISWLKDEAGRYVYVSRSYEQRFGIRQGGWLGKTDLEVWRREEAELFRRNDQAVLAADQAIEVEETTTAPDGTRTWWLNHKFTLRDSRGTCYVGGLGVDITSRKQAEATLRESQLLVAADLDAMTRLHEVGSLFIHEGNLTTVLAKIVDAAISISGADFGNIQLLHASPSGLRIAAQRGFPAWWIEFWDRAADAGSCGAALSAGERVIVEDVESSPLFVGTPALEVQRRAGVRAVQSTPLVSRTGKLLGIFSTHYRTPCRPEARVLQLLDLLAQQVADILEHAQAEDAVRESRNKLDAALASMTDAVVISDAQGRFADFNEAFATFHRVKNKSECGKTLEAYQDLLDVFMADGRPAPLDLWAVPRALRGESETNAEYTLRRRDTGETWVGSYSFGPIRDQDGTIVGSVVTARDITERKRAEQALRDSEQKYAALFEKFPFALALAPLPSAVFVAVNDAFVQMFEYLREEILGKTGVELGLMTPESQAQALATLSTRGSLRNFECTRTTRSGIKRAIILNLDSIRIGGLPHALATMHDVTEQKQAEEKARLYEKTKELDALKSRFFAGVSHELRTPLTLILGPAQRLLSSPEMSESARSDLAVIVRNGHTLERHVDDLLNAARLDAGRLQPVYEEADLGHLARFIAGHFDVLAREQHIDYRVLTPATLPAQVDPEKLQRILLNLLSNAFKFTPPQGRVRLALWQAAEDRVTFEIADSGPGIPVDKREEVFERFRQLEEGPKRRFGGTGLGLAIASELAALLRGTISIETAPEGGALFIVSLPRLAPKETAVHRAGSALGKLGQKEGKRAVEELRSVPARQTMGQSAGPLALIVEDNPEMRRFIAESLADRYRIAVAADGKEGLAKAIELVPDILITDAMMPEMSGDEMVGAVRVHRELDATPIVLVTAKADDGLRVKLLRQGVQDYITKPFSVEELRARIDNLVSVKLATEALRLSEAKLSGLVSLSLDAIILLDKNQRVTLFNEGAERMFGRSKAEMLGAALDRLLPERFRAAHHRSIQQFVDGQVVSRRMGERDARIYGLRKNGEEFPAEAAISKLNIAGELILTVVLRDITEQRRREDHQRFLAEVGAILASTLDYEETLKSIAQLAVRELADFCLLEIVEESLSVSRLVVHRDPEKAGVADALRQVPIEHGRPRLGSSVFSSKKPLLVSEVTPEYLQLIAQSDEHLRTLCALGPKSFVAMPLVTHGRLLGAMVLVSTSAANRYGPWLLPLAEELAQRAAFAVQNARLYRASQRAVAARDNMLSVVAHDLRNPLNGILLQAQLLQTGKVENVQRVGEVMQGAAMRMERLIKDLLDVARLDAGSLSVEPARIAANPIVAEVVDSQRSQAAAARCELRLDVPEKLPAVWADRDRLLQVFENLIGNALKFTAPGGTITVGAASVENAIQFWVADTGIGIPAANLPHLFERFWQAQRADRRGVGLGLPIVKGIVEAQGGRIWIESTPGRGTTFFFTVPTADQRRASAQHGAGSLDFQLSRGVRVLAVDDEGDALRALAVLLSARGFVVETARSGAEALEKLDRFSPHILLTDLQMPGLDGLDLIAQARWRCPNLPVVLTTWLDEKDQLVQTGLTWERIHYSAKPIDINELMRVITQALKAA